jgi:hypothetical protein
MEQKSSITNNTKNQLFLKKKIVIKFVTKNTLNKELALNRDTETTTIFTVPTSIVATNGG